MNQSSKGIQEKKVQYLNTGTIQRGEMMNSQQSSTSHNTSQMSFNPDDKRSKKESFRSSSKPTISNSAVVHSNLRAQTYRQQQQYQTGNDIAQQLPSNVFKLLEYPEQLRKLMRRFFQYDREKTCRLSVGQLRQACERELSRLNSIKRSNKQIRQFLSEEGVQKTDNEISLSVLSTHIYAIGQLNNSNISGRTTQVGASMSSISERAYDKILLQTERSEQRVQKFISKYLKLANPSDLSVAQCKQFFRKEAGLLEQFSDKISLSRRTLCRVALFLCRVLEGQMLAYDDVYEFNEECVTHEVYGDEQGGNLKTEVDVRRKSHKETTVRNLDKSFDELENGQQAEEYGRHSQVHGHHNEWSDYTSQDLSLKVKELAGICEQSPQLEAFARTLKFSQITLESRQGFFKLVQVLIALHNKVSYLSRRKPALMRELQTIHAEFQEIYDATHIFVENLLDSDSPRFGTGIDFSKIIGDRKEEFDGHQMTELFSHMRRDIKHLSDVVSTQDETNQELRKKVAALKAIVGTFSQAVCSGEFQRWDQLARKHSGELEDGDDGTGDEVGDKQSQSVEKQVVDQLNGALTMMDNELESRTKARADGDNKTPKNLQTEINILLEDYERQKAQIQELQDLVAALSKQREQLQLDIEQRDRMISNLTNLKLKFQKRQRSLTKELTLAQHDRENFQNIIDSLEQELERISLQNENAHRDLVYEHQDQIKELVDKKTELERSKMDLVQKYEQECLKSIQSLHGNDITNIELQALKEKLDKRSKDLEDNQKRYKDQISALQKANQQLKSEKQLLEDQLQLEEKNNKRLLGKLDEANSKYNQGVKDSDEKYEEELSAMRDNIFKFEKDLDKYKRANASLEEEVESLRLELTQVMKQNSEFRGKLTELASIQNEYDILGKEYEGLLEKLQKSDKANQDLRLKINDFGIKIQELNDALAKSQLDIKKKDKQLREITTKCDELAGSLQKEEREKQSQLKLNKSQQNKIGQLSAQIDVLNQALNSKQRSYSSFMSKHELKSKQLQTHQERQITSLQERLRLMTAEKEKYYKLCKQLQAKIQEHLDEYQAKLYEYQRQRKNLEGKLNEKNERIRQLDQDALNSASQFENARSQKLDLQSRLFQLERKLKGKQDLENKLADAQSTIQKQKADILKIAVDCDGLVQQNEILKQQLNLKQKDLQAAKNKLNSQDDNNLERQNQISKIREQIFTQKTILTKENTELQAKNFDLEQQIEKLKRLNNQLQSNIQNIQNNSAQSVQEQQRRSNSMITQYTATINDLQQSIKILEGRNRDLFDKYEKLLKTLEEKDVKYEQLDALKKQAERLGKESKRKADSLAVEVKSLQNEIADLKTRKVKGLEEELITLKRERGVNLHRIAQLQAEIQRLKKENERKLNNERKLKEQSDLDHEAQLKNLQKQLDLAVRKAKKQAQNEFNELLLKQKEHISNLSIQKIQQLQQMKNQYEKILNEHNQAGLRLQNENVGLARQINQLNKKYQQLLQQQRPNNQPDIAQLQKLQNELSHLKHQNDSFKRQLSRQQQQIQRLQNQLSLSTDEHSKLITKHLELQHSHSLMSTKFEQLKLNLESANTELKQLATLEREKITLERELQKLKGKLLTVQGDKQNLKGQIKQLEQRLYDLEQLLHQYKNAEFQWNNNNSKFDEKSKHYTNQIAELNRKIAEHANELALRDQRIRERDSDNQKLQSQFSNLSKDLQAKKRRILQLQNELSQALHKLQAQQSEWTRREAHLKQQMEALNRIIKQLQMESENGKRSGEEISQLTFQLSNLSGENANLRDKLAKLEGYLNDLRKSKGDLQNQNFNLKRQCDDLIGIKENSERNLQKLNSQNQNLKSKSSQTDGKLQKALMQIRRLQQELSIMRSQSGNATADLEKELKRMKNLHEDEMKRLQARLRGEFESQKQTIVDECQVVLKELSEKLENEQNKVNDLQNQLCRSKLHIDDLQNALHKLRADNMQMSNDIKKLQERIRQLQKERSQSQGKLSGEYQRKIHDLQDEIMKLQALLAKEKDVNDNLHRKMQSLESSLANERATKEELGKQVKSLQSQIARQKATNEDLFRQTQTLQASLTQQRAAKEDLNRLSSSHATSNEDLNRRTQQLELLLNQQKAANQDLHKHLQKLESLLDKEKVANQDLYRQIQELQRSLQKESELRQNLEIQINNNKSKLGSQQQQLGRFRAELALTRQQILRVNGLLDKEKMANQDLYRQVQELQRNFQKESELRQNLEIQINNNKSKLGSQQQQLARLRSELALTRQQIHRVNGLKTELQNQKRRLQQQLNDLKRAFRDNQANKSNSDQNLYRMNQEIESLRKRLQQSSSTEEQFRNTISEYQTELTKLRTQLALTRSQYERLNSQFKNLTEANAELSKKYSSSANIKGDIDRDIQQKDRYITEMNSKLEEVEQVMHRANKELVQKNEEYRRTSQELQKVTKLMKSKDSEILRLLQRVKQVDEKLKKYEKQLFEQQQQNDLSNSRASSVVNMNVKSYSYRGGQVTHAELVRLEEENRRLVKELQKKDITLGKNKSQIEQLVSEIKNLREQIQLMSQGKTISIKGYTRVTNPNDMSLNTKGIVYTEYDVREMKAKIDMLEETIQRYQNRENELIRELQKFKFRERGYQEQIKTLKLHGGNLSGGNASSRTGSHQITINTSRDNRIDLAQSPTKKTAFEQDSQFPKSSTYKMQSGIQRAQQNSVNNNQTPNLQGQELKTILSRIINANALIGSKIDKILEESLKSYSRESIETNIFSSSNSSSISKQLSTQIRQLIHQNKALIQTLQSMKQYRQDVTILLHTYIDPDLVTEYVYRILKYFSQIEDQSPEASLIRKELETIRANNVGGYYFTILEEYTKFILENNSIEIYKHQLRQRAKELLDFKEKFQSLIDNKIQGNNNFLLKSESKGSLMGKSRSKYLSGSRVGYGQGSEISRQDNNLRATVNDYDSVSSSINMPNIINVNTVGTKNLLNPMQTQRNRASSHITYTPYNQQGHTEGYKKRKDTADHPEPSEQSIHISQQRVISTTNPTTSNNRTTSTTTYFRKQDQIRETNYERR